MGGDLTDAPGAEAPKCMIRALRDPDNANLDRVQVIKGWLVDAGEIHELGQLATSVGRACPMRSAECPLLAGSSRSLTVNMHVYA